MAVVKSLSAAWFARRFSLRNMITRVSPHRPFSRALSRRAFTLIELLVVIAIIAILMALILPSMNGFLRKGYQSTSASNLRNWYTGFTGSVGENAGEMPLSGNENGFDPKNEDAWYNRMPRALKLVPMSQFNGQNTPKVGEHSVWNNPVVTSKYSKGANQFLFSYGYNSLLVNLSGGQVAAMKLAALQFPTLTVLMSEKADNLPHLDVTNVMAFWGSGKPEFRGDPDNTANFLFCDGHLEAFKRSVFSNQALTTSEEAIKNHTTKMTFIPGLSTD
jgi:prepilin-type N-terminal cleavage/methylation domain-containing protein/prepilin-type processing-associated H-X9-DG protein